LRSVIPNSFRNPCTISSADDEITNTRRRASRYGVLI